MSEKLILELYDRIKALEERVDALENGKATSKKTSKLKGSNKYRGITRYLQSSSSDIVEITFEEIEQIIGFKLPNSANNRAYWANTESHSIALSWLSLGYKTTAVDMENKIITFEK